VSSFSMDFSLFFSSLQLDVIEFVIDKYYYRFFAGK